MERLDFKGFGGVNLAATAFGSPENPPVLLLPSLGQIRQFWFGTAAALAEAGRYAICVDLRGHGDSAHSPDGQYELDAYIGDLHAILAALPNRAVVVTAGLGALIALAAVGEGAPHLVSGLALVDANIWVEKAVVDRLGGAMALRSSHFDDPAQIVNAIAAAYPTEPRPTLTDRMMAAYAKREDGRYEWRGDPRLLLPLIFRTWKTRLTAAAARIAAPVTLVRGSLNETVSIDVTEKLKTITRFGNCRDRRGRALCRIGSRG